MAACLLTWAKQWRIHAGPSLLFARSCFDEVGARPHNTGDLFLAPFCFLFWPLCFRRSALSGACSRFLCPLLVPCYTSVVFLCFLVARGPYKGERRRTLHSIRAIPFENCQFYYFKILQLHRFSFLPVRRRFLCSRVRFVLLRFLAFSLRCTAVSSAAFILSLVPFLFLSLRP